MIAVSVQWYMDSRIYHIAFPYINFNDDEFEEADQLAQQYMTINYPDVPFTVYMNNGIKIQMRQHFTVQFLKENIIQGKIDQNWRDN